MTVDLKGTIQAIMPIAQVSDKFKKREFVLYINDSEYPQMRKIECFQDKVTLLDKFKVGDDVIVSVNLNGKEYRNSQGIVSYFNSDVAWKIDYQTENKTVAPTTNPIKPQVKPQVEPQVEPTDDLPF